MEEKAGSLVGLWLCKGPVVRNQLAHGGPGRWKRVAARFSKCRVGGEQRERGPELPHHEGSHSYLERLGFVLRAMGSHRRFQTERGQSELHFRSVTVSVWRMHWRGTVGG